MYSDFWTVLLWTKLLFVLPSVDWLNSTVHAPAPPPFQASLTLIPAQARGLKAFHGGVCWCGGTLWQTSMFCKDKPPPYVTLNLIQGLYKLWLNVLQIPNQVRDDASLLKWRFFVGEFFFCNKNNPPPEPVEGNMFAKICRHFDRPLDATLRVQ